MENNFYDDLNQRVFQKLEKKIAIEEFKARESNTAKSYTGIKIASILLIAGIIAGNAFTYAKFNEDIFSWALNKMGILQDYNNERTDVNITKENKAATLTLTDYGVDENTLIVGYSLKLKEKTDFQEKLYDNSSIINGKNVYGLESKNSEFFYKVSDTEYTIYKLYTIDGTKLDDDVKFETYIKILKENDNPDINAEVIGDWNFSINLEKEKFELDYGDYVVENKSVKLENINPEEANRGFDLIADVVGVKRSKLTTKLVILLKGYTTDPGIRYFVEVLDEDDNVILENNTAYTIGGVPTDIILKKLPDDAKIKINIYETVINTKEINFKGTINLDFAKDLKEKEERPVNKVKKKWRYLEFEYNDINKIYENSGKLAIRGEPMHYSFSMDLKTNDNGFFQIGSYKNTLNLSLEEIYKTREKFEKYTGGLIVREYYIIYGRNEEKNLYFSATIDYNQMMDYLDGKDIIAPSYGYIDDKENFVGNQTFNYKDVKNAQNIKFYNKEKVKIDGIDAITYTTTTSDTNRHYIFIYDGYIYEIQHTSNFEVMDEMNELIKSIKFVK